MEGFRAAVMQQGSEIGMGTTGKNGSAPTPFDAVDGYRPCGAWQPARMGRIGGRRVVLRGLRYRCCTDPPA